MKTIGSLNYESLKQAGFKKCEFIGHGRYILTNHHDEKEIWVGHKFPDHCGYGIKYCSLILEFVSDYKQGG